MPRQTSTTKTPNDDSPAPKSSATKQPSAGEQKKFRELYPDGSQHLVAPDDILVNLDLNYSRAYAPGSKSTNDLAAKIDRDGQIHDVIVRPANVGSDCGLELVVGFRRVASIALLENPAVRVTVRYLSDLEAAALNLAENIDREDMSPIDHAHAVEELIELGVARKEIVTRFGKSNAWITQTLKLLKLVEPVRAKVHTGDVPVNLAYELAALDEDAQLKALVEVQESAEPKTSGAKGKKKRGARVGASARKIARKKSGKTTALGLRDIRAWFAEMLDTAGGGYFEKGLAQAFLNFVDGTDEDGEKMYEMMQAGEVAVFAAGSNPTEEAQALIDSLNKQTADEQTAKEAKRKAASEKGGKSTKQKAAKKTPAKTGKAAPKKAAAKKTAKTAPAKRGSRRGSRKG